MKWSAGELKLQTASSAPSSCHEWNEQQHLGWDDREPQFEGASRMVNAAQPISDLRGLTTPGMWISALAWNSFSVIIVCEKSKGSCPENRGWKMRVISDCIKQLRGFSPTGIRKGKALKKLSPDSLYRAPISRKEALNNMSSEVID